MAENRARISLSREMSDRVHRVQMFFERLKLHADEEFISSIGIVCLQELIESAQEGFTVGGYDGLDLVQVPYHELQETIGGQEFDRWYLNDIPEDMLIVCQDLRETIQSTSLEGVLLTGLFVLSHIVELLEEGYELVKSQPINELDTTMDYWRLEVFDRFRPKHIQ